MLAYIISSKADNTPKVVSRTGTITNAIKQFLIRKGITKARVITSEKAGDGVGQLIEI